MMDGCIKTETYAVSSVLSPEVVLRSLFRVCGHNKRCQFVRWQSERLDGGTSVDQCRGSIGSLSWRNRRRRFAASHRIRTFAPPRTLPPKSTSQTCLRVVFCKAQTPLFPFVVDLLQTFRRRCTCPAVTFVVYFTLSLYNKSTANRTNTERKCADNYNK